MLKDFSSYFEKLLWHKFAQFDSSLVTVALSSVVQSVCFPSSPPPPPFEPFLCRLSNDKQVAVVFLIKNEMTEYYKLLQTIKCTHLETELFGRKKTVSFGNSVTLISANTFYAGLK